MNYLLAIISIPVAVIIFYHLLKKPLWLLGCYIVAVPVLPPIPIGSIEISVLDILTIPTLIHLIYNFSKTGFKIKGSITIGFLLYVLVAVISFISFTIQQTSLSMPIMFRVIRLIEMLLPVLLASQLVHTMKKDFPVVSFLIAAAVTSVIAVIMFLNGISLKDSQTFAREGELIYRAAGTHGDTGSFGTLMGFASLIAVWVLIYMKELKTFFKNNYTILITIVCGALTILGLITALSRGGFILLAVGLFVLLLPLLKRPGRMFKVIISALIIIVIAIPISETFTDNNLISIGFEMYVKRISGLTELVDDNERVTGGRTVFWDMAWGYFKSNPLSWPFGLGYKSLRLHYNIPPDNNFNQAFFEMGIFGALALLALLYFIFTTGFRVIKNNLAFGIIILAVWLSLISNMLSADVLTYWHNIPALFILLVVISGNHEKPSHSIQAETK